MNDHRDKSERIRMMLDENLSDLDDGFDSDTTIDDSDEDPVIKPLTKMPLA